MFLSILTVSYLLKLTLTSADSICGPNARFMVALTCNDDNTQLYCAPNNLKNREEFCQNPNLKWSEAKCKQMGGYKETDLDNTGCYTLSSEYWGGDINCTGINIPEKVDYNLGFEKSSFDDWTVSGTTTSSSIICDSTAPEGMCYAQTSTEGTGPSTGPNKIENNNIVIYNYGGCNGGDYILSFWYKFVAGDYTPFNDYIKVTSKDNNNNILVSKVLDVNTVGDYGSSPWILVNTNIGSVPTGEKLSLTIYAETKNSLDSILTSYGYIDGISIIKA